MAAPLSRMERNRYRVPKGQLFGRVRGSGANFRSFGNLASLAMNLDQTINDYQTNEDSLGTPAFSDPATTNATLTFETRNIDDFIAGLRYIATPTVFTQEVAATVTATAAAPIQVDDVIDLGKFNITAVASFEAGEVAFVQGTHYVLDSQAGIAKIIALPNDYDDADDGLVTFAAGAYEATRFEGLSRGGNVEIEFIYRYTNAIGRKELVRVYNTSLRPDGDQSWIEDSDLGTSSFTATMQQDPAAPAPGYFTATNLPDILA